LVGLFPVEKASKPFNDVGKNLVQGNGNIGTRSSRTKPRFKLALEERYGREV